MGDYSAKIAQLDRVMGEITKDNFNLMLESLGNLPSDSPESDHSTNFDILADRLLSDDASWISTLNDILDSY